MAFDPYAPVPRLLGIVARTGHLFAMAVFVGGVWLEVPAPLLASWRTAAIGRGLLLLASEVSHEPRQWVFQMSGLAVVLHAAALGQLAADGRVATGLALVVGAAGSHAPKRVRKWSPRRGRRRGQSATASPSRRDRAHAGPARGAVEVVHHGGVQAAGLAGAADRAHASCSSPCKRRSAGSVSQVDLPHSSPASRAGPRRSRGTGRPAAGTAPRR